jgi:hypothetical protein
MLRGLGKHCRVEATGDGDGRVEEIWEFVWDTETVAAFWR